MNEKCFGLKVSNKGRTVCSVREVNPGKGSPQCIGYQQCPFYKPKWKHDQSRKKALQRISKLPLDVQMHIAEKYYEGEMPWVNEEV